MNEDHPQTEAVQAWVARARRRGVALEATIFRTDGTSVHARLSDISYDGCRVSTPQPLKVGELLIVRVLDLGQIDAEVRWVEGQNAGLLFGAHVPVPPQLRSQRRRKRD
jgi:hypothetical protein